MILLIFAGNHEQYRQWYDQNSRWRDSARYVGGEPDIHGFNPDDVHLVRVGTWFENDRIQSLLDRAVVYYGPRFMELPLAPPRRPPAEIRTEGEPFDTDTTFTVSGNVLAEMVDTEFLRHTSIGEFIPAPPSRLLRTVPLRTDEVLSRGELEQLIFESTPTLDNPVYLGVDTAFEGPIESFRSAALRHNQSIGSEVAPPLENRVKRSVEERPDCRCHCHHKVKCKCIKKCKHCENTVS